MTGSKGEHGAVLVRLERGLDTRFKPGDALAPVSIRDGRVVWGRPRPRVEDWRE